MIKRKELEELKKALSELPDAVLPEIDKWVNACLSIIEQHVEIEKYEPEWGEHVLLPLTNEVECAGSMPSAKSNMIYTRATPEAAEEDLRANRLLAVMQDWIRDKYPEHDLYGWGTKIRVLNKGKMVNVCSHCGSPEAGSVTFPDHIVADDFCGLYNSGYFDEQL